MSVYVDELFEYGGSETFRWKVSCHMFTDPGNEEELHAMAKKIGLKREWFQNKKNLPHYDLTESKRKKAVASGAIEVDSARDVMKAYKERESFMVKGTPIQLTLESAVGIGIFLQNRDYAVKHTHSGIVITLSQRHVLTVAFGEWVVYDDKGVRLWSVNESSI